MIYLKLKNELIDISLISIINILLIILLLITVKYYRTRINSRTGRNLFEYNAKPVYLRYIKYDPETGNIKYTD